MPGFPGRYTIMSGPVRYSSMTGWNVLVSGRKKRLYVSFLLELTSHLRAFGPKGEEFLTSAGKLQ